MVVELLVAALVAKGGPPGPDPVPSPVQITVYDNSVLVGRVRCALELRLSAPGSTCVVRPAAGPAWWWPW